MIPTPEGSPISCKEALVWRRARYIATWRGNANVRRAPFAGHIRKSNIKMFGHLLLNLIDGNRFLGFCLQNIQEKLFYRFAGNLSAIQRLVRGNPHQGTLQTPNIGSNPLREKIQNILSKLDMKCLGLFPENRHASLDIRRLQFRC
jgi:hypothetical protein